MHRDFRRVMGEVGASEGEGEDVTTVVYRCRRRDRRRFTCDQLEIEYGDVVFKERNVTEVTLGADGLVPVGRLRYEPM